MHIIHIVLRLWREGLELALLVFVVPEIGAEVDGDDVFGEGGVGDYGVVLTLRDWNSWGWGEERTEGDIWDGVL